MRRLFAVLAVVAATLATTAGPALASCLIDERPLAERLAEFPLVFVGTTTALNDNGRSAEFAVEEVWHGEIGTTVVVHGGQPGTPPTSIDRSFTADTTYLVAARAEGGTFATDACAPTEEWDEERHGAARPASVSEPRASDDGSTTGEPVASENGSATPWAIGAAVIVLGLGAVALLRQRGKV